jgi:PST family polysaccharide transporter/lipopolysaccharide exporter
LLLARGKPELGFQWSILIVCIQLPGIYTGVLSGGAVGVAVAFAVLACVYLVLNYVILIRNLLGPCMRDYIMAIWPYILMSAIMAGVMIGVTAVLPHLWPPFLLIFQTGAGLAVYALLLWHRKKPLLLEATELVSV